QQPFQPLAQLGPDRIQQVYVVIGQEVLDVDRIEARGPRFLDHADEVQPRFDDEGAKLMRPALAESQRQEIQVPGGIEAPGEEISSLVGDGFHDMVYSWRGAVFPSADRAIPDSGTIRG